jgi:hypothetical protein
MELGSLADWTAGLVAVLALLVATVTQAFQFFDRRDADAQGLRASVVYSSADNHHRTLYGIAVKLLNEEGRAKSNIKVHLTAGSHGGVDFPTLNLPTFQLGGFEERSAAARDDEGGPMNIKIDLLPRNEKASAIFYSTDITGRKVSVFFNDFRGKRWVLDYRSGKLAKAKPADEPLTTFNDIAGAL